jgi:uncharacterized membrane protein
MALRRLLLIISKKYLVLITLGLFVWLAGIVLAPVMVSSGIPWLTKFGNWCYFFFDPVCHQISSRSFILNGFPMAVCVRCFSVYLAGFFLCLVSFRRHIIRLLPLPVYVLLLVPALSDFILEKIILYPGLPMLRFATGFLMGLALFHLMLVSMATAGSETKNLSRTGLISDR